MSDASTSETLAYSFVDLPVAVIGAATEVTENYITVLGQKIYLDEVSITTRINPNEELVAEEGKAGLQHLSYGDYVVVAGEFIEPGKILGTVVAKANDSYEPGNSIAYVRSKFNSISNGAFTINSGDTSVDPSNALYDQEVGLATEADSVEFYGFTTASNPFKLIATYGEVVNERFRN